MWTVSWHADFTDEYRFNDSIWLKVRCSYANIAFNDWAYFYDLLSSFTIYRMDVIICSQMLNIQYL